MSQSNTQIQAATTTFRDLVTNAPPNGIVPTFMMGPVLSRYLYSMAIMYDALLDAGGYALRAGLPNYAPLDAFAWFSQDRQIVRGPDESQVSYTARLVQWLDLWRHAGSPTSVLLALLAYLYPVPLTVETVQAPNQPSGIAWNTYLLTDDPFPPGQQNPTPPAHLFDDQVWNWDGNALPYFAPWMYWRTWVVVVAANTPWVAPPSAVWASGGSLNVAVVSDTVYGSKYQNQSPASPGSHTFTWGDGTCWGWAGTAAQAAGLSSAIVQWKAASSWVPWIIVVYNNTWFTPQSLSADMPDGTWGYCGTLKSDATYGSVWKTSRPSCSIATFVAGPPEARSSVALGLG